MPTPKWKLVVDVGAAPPPPKGDNSKPVDRRIHEVLKLITDHAPANKNSPYSPYLPGFTSLRLLLIKGDRTQHENELMTTMLDSYSSYLPSGRQPVELAWMIARDFMLLTQTSHSQRQVQAPAIQQQPQVPQQPLQQAAAPAGLMNHHVHQQQILPQGTTHQQNQASILPQPVAQQIAGGVPVHAPAGAVVQQQVHSHLQAAVQPPQAAIHPPVPAGGHSAFHPLLQQHSSPQLPQQPGGPIGL